MKKTYRLTESDLLRITKKVISEQIITVPDNIKRAWEFIKRGYQGPAGFGTDENALIQGFQLLNNKKDFDDLENFLKTTSMYKSVAQLVNGELGTDDLTTIQNIARELQRIGVASNWKSDKNKMTFTPNSFTIKAAPTPVPKPTPKPTPKIEEGAWTSLEVTFGKPIGKTPKGGVRHKVGNDIYTFYSNGRYYNPTTGKKGNWVSDWNDVIIDGKRYKAKGQITNKVSAPDLITVSECQVTLKKGMTGPSINQLQELLRKQGVFTVKSTNYFGPVTDKAVRDFQTKIGVTPNGIVDCEILSKLQKIDTPLDIPSKGLTVKPVDPGRLMIQPQLQIDAKGNVVSNTVARSASANNDAMDMS